MNNAYDTIPTMGISKKQDKLKGEIRIMIAEVVSEILNDPDYGLELSDETKKILRVAKHDKTRIPLARIKEKYLK